MYKIYRNLIEINKSVDNIDMGGCGYFALKLSDYLEQKNIPHQILTIKYSNKKIPHHVMVKTKWGIVDSKGFFSHFIVWLYSLDNLKYIQKNELKHLLTLDGWNKKFNKKDTIFFKFN